MLKFAIVNDIFNAIQMENLHFLQINWISSEALLEKITN